MTTTTPIESKSSKNSEPQVSHILIIETTTGTKKLELKKAVYSIGRHSNNSIVLSSEKVSRFHATIFKKPSTHPDSYWIMDGNFEGKKSQNGIFINGEKCWIRELRHRDRIQICDTTIKYYLIYPSQKENLKRKVQVKIEQDKKLEKLTDTDLIKLASFPNSSPHPIIEIDFSGNINYLNPVASQKFPDLEKSKLEHPLLETLLPPHSNNFSRSVKIGNEFFEEYIQYLHESKLVRIYVFEISSRKYISHKPQFYDQLTGLPNQMLLNEHLSFALTNINQKNRNLAIILIQLNNLKKIKENLGEDISNKLLQKTAKLLTSHCQEGYTCARWQEDKFAVLLPEINGPEEVAKMSKQICQTLAQPLQVKQHLIYLETNIGIAVYPQDGEQATTLLSKADRALIRSQEEGNNNYQFYNKKIQSDVSKVLQLEQLLAQAIKKQEFVLYYQPQFNINTRKICGVEALLRWQKPNNSLIFPTDFMKQAEKSGLIIPIGEWVLQTAAAQNKAWQKAGLPPITIAVNIGQSQFTKSNLITTVTKVLEQTELDPKWLELEITETTLMQSGVNVNKKIPALLEMGVNLCLDDFGTGYSSQGYLKKYNFNTLKIAQIFIRDLQNNPQDRAIISTAITLGFGFNMRVIAEGVETPEQLEILRSLRCSQIQGYLFSKPLNVEEMTQLLAQSSHTI